MLQPHNSATKINIYLKQTNLKMPWMLSNEPSPTLLASSDPHDTQAGPAFVQRRAGQLARLPLRFQNTP